MSEFIKQQEKLAATALPLLQRSLIMANLVDTQNGADFKGALGDVLNIRRPAVLAAASEAITRSKSRSIQTQNIVESTIQVKLTTHLYSAVDITDAEATLDIESFADQVLHPQVQSIAWANDLFVRDALETLPALKDKTGATVTIPLDADPEIQAKNIRLIIPLLRKKLNDNHVPSQGRVLVVGTELESYIIRDPHLTRLDQSGATSALREASIGRLYGFDIVVSDVINPGEMIALHPTAFKLAMIAPVAPAGAAFATSQSANGVSMRYIRDYNSDKAMDRSFLSVYVGISPILDPLFNAKGEYVDATGAVLANPTAETIVQTMQRGYKVALASA
ncbi:P22 phage major capsid protein family protein [Kitasatospora griseola]|uniref:P22 phage major capsid protein family protein n=1 Tax=Kitasatospora griseola TaxID=2064 RepID=UPI0006974290|nr:P22 phage major capsid protein family protein [Kitasatospora griseola]